MKSMDDPPLPSHDKKLWHGREKKHRDGPSDEVPTMNAYLGVTS